MSEHSDALSAQPDAHGDPLAHDAAFAAWPSEVREAWSAWKLPSLHEMLLGQERLAAEIRRQNQDIRRLAAAAPHALQPPSDTDALARIMAEARDLGERLAAGSVAGLIALAESADRHAGALDAAVRHLLAQPYRRSWFSARRAWPHEIRDRLLAQVAGARLVKDKARQSLADAGMTRIAPSADESFDPELHRCVGTVQGPSGRIVRCEREGWRSAVAILRPAEVIIGTTVPRAEGIS